MRTFPSRILVNLFLSAALGHLPPQPVAWPAIATTQRSSPLARPAPLPLPRGPLRVTALPIYPPGTQRAAPARLVAYTQVNRTPTPPRRRPRLEKTPHLQLFSNLKTETGMGEQIYTSRSLPGWPPLCRDYSLIKLLNHEYMTMSSGDLWIFVFSQFVYLMVLLMKLHKLHASNETCLTFRVLYHPVPPLTKHGVTSRSTLFRPSTSALSFHEIPVR